MAQSCTTPSHLRMKTKALLMFPEASPSISTVIQIQSKHEQTLLLSLPFSSWARLRSHSVHLPVPCYPQILLVSHPPLSQHAAFDGQTHQQRLPRRIPAQKLSVPVLISPFQTSGKFLEETGAVANWWGLERAMTLPCGEGRKFILRPPNLSLLALTWWGPLWNNDGTEAGRHFDHLQAETCSFLLWHLMSAIIINTKIGSIFSDCLLRTEHCLRSFT